MVYFLLIYIAKFLFLCVATAYQPIKKKLLASTFSFFHMAVSN